MARLPDETALNRLYDGLNARWWGQQLPKVPVRWSPRMHALAGKYWQSREELEIVLSLPYHSHYPAEVDGTLKHEMVHVWMHKKGMRKHQVMHGSAFKAEADRVGAPLYCQSYPGIRRPYRYEWECPQCHRRSCSRRRGDWACRFCCETYNGGRYSPRFKLRLVRRLIQT
jgi:predicted SprT family Zn-dependent metalloprotease